MEEKMLQFCCMLFSLQYLGQYKQKTCGSDDADLCALQLQQWEPPGPVPASTASLPSLRHQPSLPSRQSTSRCCSSRTVGDNSASALPLHPLPHFSLSSSCLLKDFFFFRCRLPLAGMMSCSRTAVDASLSKALSHTVAALGSWGSYHSVCFCFPRQL